MTRTRLSPRARFSCDYSTGEERIGKETGSQGHVAGNDITSCAIFVSFFFGHIDVKLSFFISKPLIKHLAKRRLLKLQRPSMRFFSQRQNFFKTENHLIFHQNRNDVTRNHWNQFQSPSELIKDVTNSISIDIYTRKRH